jgi:hypothetical protein
VEGLAGEVSVHLLDDKWELRKSPMEANSPSFLGSPGALVCSSVILPVRTNELTDCLVTNARSKGAI